ncbi:dsDNA nuclease domain-containing protein [Sphingorhabdus sp. 109]|jgi:hypothetical protein|uniref:dsDNA nuclease domain-containing protein n=1 Tax=Sphingorhabdus sp. 109 TaxID=2653173 RepID=UPI001357C66C|nr:dsDNA nuclease domain-containing protein [Sphingorhabdus sp. 109]
MSLPNKLAGEPLRETSGSLTQARFDFQTYWGLALICKQHLSDENYAVLFEFHDDIVLLDDFESPKTADFFQVKTKSSTALWSLADLKYRKKKAVKKNVEQDPETETHLPSILGKMFDNIEKFGDYISSVCFVSNAPCGLNISSTNFRFKDCNPSDFAKIAEAVKSEYPNATDAQISLLGFEKTELSLEDPATHAKGKLHDLVTVNLGATEFDLETLFKAIVSECRKKSIFKDQLNSFEHIVQKKGISRSDVQSWLDSVQATSMMPAWSEIAPELHCGILEKLKIRDQWQSYRAQALDPGNESIRLARLYIRKQLEKASSDISSLTILVDETAEEIKEVCAPLIVPFSSYRLKAMVIYEIYSRDKD